DPVHGMNAIILLLVIGAVAYRITKPEERARYFGLAIDFGRQLRAAANMPRPEVDRLRDALRARMPRVVVTPAVAAVDAIRVAGLLFGAGALGNPDTLLAWGASLGPRTTNGEWWRLLTSIFLHVGMLHLLIDLAILIQLGIVLERLVGAPMFAAVYLSAGVFT